MAKYSLIIGFLCTTAGMLSGPIGISALQIVCSTLGLILVSIVIIEVRLKD